MLMILIALVLIALGLWWAQEEGSLGPKVLCAVLAIALIVFSVITIVPAGHVKVATLFGEVQQQVYREGLHMVNPLLNFETFDTRQKTHKETAQIPAEDKLLTGMEVSVQYRVIAAAAPDILQNTGNTDTAIEVHLIPKLRSILREQGKGIAQSQDFFKEEVQQRLQHSLREGLFTYLKPMGLQVDTVLIRHIELPEVIQTAIKETKKREQEVLKQEAELQRYATEQNQLVKKAQSELEAAKLEAQKVRELANAEAYKIEKVNQALSQSPQYIALQIAQQWNGTLPQTMLSDKNMPLIGLKP